MRVLVYSLFLLRSSIRRSKFVAAIFVTVLLLVQTQLVFGKTKSVSFKTYSGDDILKVFVLKNEKFNQTYVLRLHESGAAELNKYTHGKKPAFRQVSGKFRERRHAIRFHWNTRTEVSKFPEKLYKGKTGLHYSIVDAIKGVDADIALTEDVRYQKPCFIDPVSNTVIREKDFMASLPVEELALGITQGAETEEEKIASIVTFMCAQFRYGDGEQKDLKKILSQTDPRLRSSGYAEVFYQLATANGIEVRKENARIPTHVALAMATGGEVHDWNVVRLNGEDRVVDVCRMDDLNGEDPLRSAYYLAYSNEVQLAYNVGEENTEPFEMRPYVELLAADPVIGDFLPKKGVQQVNDIFQFIPVGEVKEDATIKAWWFDMSMADLALEGELAYKGSLKGELIHTGKLLQSTPVDVNIKGKTNGFLRIETDGIAITWCLVNSGREQLYTTWFKRRDNKHLISYTRTILSGILLGDVNGFNEMIGNTTNVKPYVLRTSAMEELQQSLQNWTGEIASITKITGTSELIPVGESHVYSVMIPGQVELLFSGDGSGGYGLRSIRAPFIKK